MVDVVITLPSTVETLQYRFGRAIPTISQARNPRKKAKASTMAFILPCFLYPTNVKLSRERNTLQTLTLRAILLRKRVDLSTPKCLCARPVPNNPSTKMPQKTTNQWFIPNSPLMIIPIILDSIEPFQRCQMLTQLKGQQGGEVQPSSLLTNVYRPEAICHLLTFALNTVSIISNRYWWDSSHVLTPHLNPVSEGWWVVALRGEDASSHTDAQIATFVAPQINPFACLTTEPEWLLFTGLTNVALFVIRPLSSRWWSTKAAFWPHIQKPFYFYLTLFQMFQTLNTRTKKLLT